MKKRIPQYIMLPFQKSAKRKRKNKKKKMHFLRLVMRMKVLPRW